MPLDRSNKYRLEFTAEDGTTEALIFHRPTTQERQDIMYEIQQAAGSLEQADKDWRKFQNIYLARAVAMLEDAEVSCEGRRVTEFDGWKDLLAADVFYADRIEEFADRFFRPHARRLAEPVAAA